MLTIRGLNKIYADVESQERIIVFEDADFELLPGQAVSITGESGSGKSTLLNIIGALDRDYTGELLFSGRDIKSMSSREILEFRSTSVGFVFQFHHLLPQCTVLENVLLPSLPLSEKFRKDASERALHLLEKTGLKDKIHRLPSSLSGGECQRAAIARSLINQPRLILADEPTGFLDRKRGMDIAELFIRINQEEHTALILFTHSMELAGRMGGRFRIADRKILAQKNERMPT